MSRSSSRGSPTRGLGLGLIALPAVALSVAYLIFVITAPRSKASFPGRAGKIAFESDRDGDVEIFSANPNGSGQTQLTFNSAEDPDGDGPFLAPDIDTRPAFSPDGRRIAFDSNRDGDYEVFVMNADGSGQKQLTRNRADEASPAFSPDGRRIVFSSARTGDGEIFVMNADGSGQKQLTSAPGRDSYPVFSPDRRRIVFTSERDGDAEIFVMNADGSGQKQLTRNSAKDFIADFSPDGRRITFASNRDGDREIFVMNANGSGQTQLTFNTKDTPSDPADDARPVFSPDGRRIAFVSNRDGDYDVFVMNANGSEQTPVTFNSDFDRFPDWQPIPFKCGGKRATLTGTPGRDSLKGTRRADVILGLGGADVIGGGAGKDLLCGGKGKDRLTGGKGRDALLGQAKPDVLQGGPKRDALKGGKGRDRCVGGKGRDRASGCEESSGI